MKTNASHHRFQPIVHRLSLALALVVFPLIWVGGLVTTYDAGMAVPDWPNTYGYNVFMYPIYDWFFGPWDLFVEHGHRLLATLAGLMSIIVVVVTWWRDRRTWFRWLAVAALAFVIFQGVLGGLRVVWDQRQIAKIHGCVGPMFFVTVMALVVGSSRWWFAVRKRAVGVRHSVAAVSLARMALVMLLLGMAQLVVGASMRHIAVTADPMIFRSLVVTHLSLAVVILLGACCVAILCFRREFRGCGFRVPGLALAGCVWLQISLGIGSWIVKFGWPMGFDRFGLASSFIVGEKNFLQMNIITGHVAIGSLLLAVVTLVALRGYRIASFVDVGYPTLERVEMVA